MSPDKKSKRQERREKMKQQEKRGRFVTLGLITLGAALLVFAFVYPSLKPIAEVVTVSPGEHYNPIDNAMGDPNAPIKIEEFSDFQCPFCERFHEQTEPLLVDYYVKTGKVQFYYRSMGNWVSRNIGGARTESQDAAAAAYCAGDQGKFWEMHAHLFANVLGEDVGSFTDRRLEAIAEAAGLNMDEFRSCYDSGKFKDRVQQDFQDGTAAGVTGTPSFLITYTVNGETKTKLIEGAQPFSAFQVELEAILAELGQQ
ncbi:MAG: disulfide bond formation protein DsbA [Anaerolineales bacterium]|nr:disulfide bond formation protein DsbA [Anaerolineae bacterium]PWB74053.1 MAG: disulfide bond formation protein DsbA [Anaerolineales bacterium]